MSNDVPLHERRVVYKIPEMNNVRVKRDLIYKSVDGTQLEMDVYIPASASLSVRVPGVLFIHGDPVPSNARAREVRLAILLVLLGSLLFANFYLFVPNTDAWTDLEGTITQDTTLTLANSPYRVAKDVTVTSGVKLTIEPWVEVQFADGFSLIVNRSKGITVGGELPSLIVSLTLNPTNIESNETLSVSVYVRVRGLACIGDVSVQLVSDKGGKFTQSSGHTDSNGYFSTTFTAVNVAEVTNVRVTATASKSGYTDGSDYKYAAVHPAGSLHEEDATLWIYLIIVIVILATIISIVEIARRKRRKPKEEVMHALKQK